MNNLWVEKYRPNTISEYVFTDAHQRDIVDSWIKEGSIPHLLLSGSPGTGKTTLAKVLINELGVNDYDILYANGSKEGRKVDWIIEKLEPFCQTMPFGNMKIVLIDEADFMNPQSVQPALRNLMESYSIGVRFILTCNYPNKIIPALHSRCQGFHIDKTDVTEFTARVATVLVTEGVEFDLDTLDSYVKATYPDLRKCLQLCQQNSKSGSLVKPGENDRATNDWRLVAVDMFKGGQIIEARKLICSQSSMEDIDGIYRWMYDNLDLWGKTQDAQDAAIHVIKNGLVNHALCADAEINLSSVLAELTSL